MTDWLCLPPAELAWTDTPYGQTAALDFDMADDAGPGRR